MITEHAFAARAERTAALARDILARLEAGVRARGGATLVATGGSTPAPLYDALAALPGPWDRTTVTLTDERWLDPGSPDSNENLVRRHLLVGQAGAARLVPLKTAAADPAAAAPAVERALGALPRPFDVVVLGMGPDGHFASLFPQAEELAAGLDANGQALVLPVRRAGAAGSAERLSLTLAAVLDARVVALLIDGEAKRALWREAVAGEDAHALPIRAVLNQSKTDIEIWWAP